MTRPDYEWEARCEAQERAYRALSDGKTCEDCANCVEPAESLFANPERLGYCQAAHEFVCLDDFASEVGCCEFE